MCELASPQAEALLKPVLVAHLPQEPLEPVLVGALRRVLEEEEPSESVCCLLENCSSIHLLPSWSRPNRWSVYSHHAFKVLYCAPPSTLADTAGVSSTSLPPRHNVMTTLCGLFVGSTSSEGGARVPLYLVGDVVAY